MNTKPDFTPEFIRENLKNELSLIYQGLDLGCGYTRHYFTEYLQRELNKPLAANIARYHALDFVTARKPVNDFFLQKLLNNGIGIKKDWCQIRTLKMFDGEAPTATNSKTSQLFYSQDLPTQRSTAPKLSGIDWDSFIKNSAWDDFVKQVNFLNLILCWGVDRDYNLTTVQLMCPRRSNGYGRGVSLFWQITVPHPIESIVAPTINESEADDLPIFFEDEGEIFGND
jgi:hypothetical protein